MKTAKEEILLWLKERGEINSFERKFGVKPKHGPCCCCSRCGHFHDECVCSHNEWLDAVDVLVGRLEKRDISTDKALNNRCPECHRFGVELQEYGYQCLWRDCHWRGTQEEIDNGVHPKDQFKKFRDSIKKKTSIG